MSYKDIKGLLASIVAGSVLSRVRGSETKASEVPRKGYPPALSPVVSDGIVDTANQAPEIHKPEIPYSATTQVQKEYEVARSSRGLVVKLRGVELLSSSTQDRSYFRKDIFTPQQLELDARIEQHVQEASRGKYRDFSGWYAHRHYENCVEGLFRIHEAAKVPISLRELIMMRVHDLFEDDPSINRQMIAWEALVQRGDAGDYQKIQELETELTMELKTLRNRTQEVFEGYMPAGMKRREKNEVETEIREGLELAWGLTRAKYGALYAESMRQIFSRGRGHHGKLEPMRRTLERSIGKLEDRSDNVNDYTAIPQEIAAQAILVFQDPTTIDGIVVREEFLKRFEGIKYVKDMPPAIQVRTAFSSLFPLDYTNILRNQYGAEIANGRYSPRVRNLFRVLEVAENQMLEATLNQLDSAIRVYETDPEIKGLKEVVDRKMTRAHADPDYLYRVTDQGPVQLMLRLDAQGRSEILKLDEDKYSRAIVYEAARGLRELFPRFGMYHPIGDKRNLQSNPELYYPKRHYLFVLENLEEALSLLPTRRTAGNPIRLGISTKTLML